MGVHRIPDGAVLLTGEALEAVAYAVSTAQTARRRNGYPPMASLCRLSEALSPAGQADSPDEEIRDADHMTTEEAATVLGVSCRTVRRLAPGLGGHLVGGRWFLDRMAVAEHKRGMQ